MIRIEGGEISIGRVSKAMLKNVKESLNVTSRILQSYVRTEKLTGGTTDTRLRVRTGRLRASVRPLPVKISGDEVSAGISFGTQYARPHVGPRGQITIIKPKKAKALTIPLPAVMTSAGVVRGSAKSFMGEHGLFGRTFIAKSKAGEAIIFGQRRISKGKRTGELRSKILPLFVLKKSVRIKARVHPKNILDWIKPKMIEDLRSRAILK